MSAERDEAQAEFDRADAAWKEWAAINGNDRNKNNELAQRRDDARNRLDSVQISEDLAGKMYAGIDTEIFRRESPDLRSILVRTGVLTIEQEKNLSDEDLAESLRSAFSS